MIEAPEAAYMAVQLNETIKGKTITEVYANSSSHKFAWFHGDPEDYMERLTGRQITAIRSQGGILEITAGSNTRLLLTDGVNLRYFGPGEKLPAKHQLLVAFEDESCIVASVRMYGGIFCFEEGTFDSMYTPYYEVAKDKPQVLGKAFTREYFRGLTDAEPAQKKTAKALLATEQTIPGVGNGVLHDILYLSGIHPKRKVHTLTDADKDRLYTQLRATLREMYEAGGRSNETDIFGTPGRYVCRLSKDTAGSPCTRCGEPIRKENYLGGSIYYCSECQPL